MYEDKSHDIEIIKYGHNVYSMKDLRHDVRISEKKWDFLFRLLLEDMNSVYFYGVEVNYQNTGLLKDINFAAEKILLNTDKQKTILFKIKVSAVEISLNLLSNIWNGYQFPRIIFLGDDNLEGELVSLISDRAYLTDILRQIQGLKIIYMEPERDVLWLQHNFVDLDIE